MVALDPCTHIMAQLHMVHRCVVRLVREHVKEAVAVAKCCSVQPERAQLLHQQLAFGAGSDLSAWQNEFMSLIALRMEKVTEHGLHNTIGCVCVT
jgi:hypothetical protein